MGKVPYYTDSESEASTSAETMKKKKKFSILKYTTDNMKKKCRVHSLPRPEEPEFTTKMQKLRGILKHNNNKEYSASEDDLEEFNPSYSYPAGKCLVGRVPRTPGGRPGHGGGVAIVVRRSPHSPRFTGGSESAVRDVDTRKDAAAHLPEVSLSRFLPHLRRLQSQSLRAQPSVSGAKVRKSMLKSLGRKPSY